MPFHFRYSARNTKGESSDGEIEALDLDDAKKKLQAQGLLVDSIHVILSGLINPVASPEKKDNQAPAVAQAPTVAIQDVRNFLPYIGAGLAILVLFFLIMFFSTKKSNTPAVNKKIPFEIVKVEDFSEGKVGRESFTIVVPKEAKEGEVKYVAQKIFNSEKARDDQLGQAMFNFFYQHQDYKLHTPVAVLRWNWDNSGTWEYSFTFERSEDGESVNVQRTGLVEGDYVLYEVTLSDSISLEGSQKIVMSELNRIKDQWQGKVKLIRADVVYKYFSDPFMTCEMNLSGTPGNNTKCELVKE